jgi:hypothetical protein
MNAVAIWDYIRIGACLRFLQDARAGWSITKKNWVLDNIGSFIDDLSALSLNVTMRASYKLIEFQEELGARPKDALLSNEDAQKLKQIMQEIRLTFVAETQGIYAYFVTDKRLDVKKLLEHVDQLFNPEAFQSCPETACHDFNQAGLCIAFELPTAAAFHVLRGTEDVLRLYYKKYIRPAKQGLTWGQMINELKNKAKGKKPDSILLNNLDNIRHSFRNPTQHPDKIYDINEAQDLFSLCIDVVNRMILAK